MVEALNYNVNGKSKKILAVVILLSFIVPLFGFVEVSALKIGDEIGNVLNTDIKTYIDGHRIPSYNIGGKSAVLIKDLINYGFDSVYNDEVRMSSVTHNPNKKITPITKFEENTKKPGTVAFRYVYTDIIALVNGKRVESFNIKGNLAIFFGSLKDYGTFAYNDKERVSRFTSNKTVLATGKEESAKSSSTSQSNVNTGNSSNSNSNSNTNTGNSSNNTNNSNTNNNTSNSSSNNNNTNTGSSNNTSNQNSNNNSGNNNNNSNQSQNNQPNQIAQSNSSGESYTVKFNLNYSNPKGEIPDQKVQKGSNASRPTTETVKRENYLLTGWYTDRDCKNEFSFDTTISRNITLYAKWITFNDSADWYKDYTQINDTIKEISKKYYNNKGYIDLKDFKEVIDEVEIYAKNLYEQDKILEYACNGKSVDIRFKDGSYYLYVPSNNEVMSGGSGVRIESYRPFKSSILDNFDDSWSMFVQFVNPWGSTFMPIPEIVKLYTDVFQKVGYSTVYNKYENIEVDFRILKNMAGDIILWEGHGGLSRFYGSVLFTDIEVNNITTEYIKMAYSEEWNNGGIVAGEKHYYITYKYINSLPNRCFNGALIYLNTCHSLEDKKLAQAFLDKGAGAVIGNDETIQQVYGRYLLANIMETLLKTNGKTGDLYTVKEAIEFILSLKEVKDMYDVACFGGSKGNVVCYPEESKFNLSWLLNDEFENEIKLDGLIYNITTDGKAKVIGVYEKRRSYNIPEYISVFSNKDFIVREYKVIEIMDKAFEDVGAKIEHLPTKRLERIGNYAFKGMDLSECEFPLFSTLACSIGEGAFEEAILPKKFTLDGNYQDIGIYAFYDVKNVETLHIGKDFKLDIGEIDGFFACKDLKEVTVENRNQYYKAFDGVLYSKYRPSDTNYSFLCIYPAKRTGSVYNVLDKTQTINPYAFYYSGLKEIVLPETVNTIKGDAFYYCDRLERMTIENTQAKIDIFAIQKNKNQEITIFYYLPVPNAVDKFVDAYNEINSDHTKKLICKILLIVPPQGTTGVEGAVLFILEKDVPEHLADIYNSTATSLLTGATVTLYDINNSTKTYSDVTDGMGCYKIYCPEGKYKIEVEKSGYKKIEGTIDKVEVKKDKIVSLDNVYLVKDTLENSTGKNLPKGAIAIETEADLRAIPKGATGHYVLMNDITLTKEWEPIEDFQGTFDGQGYSINNLYILKNSNKQYAGLFGEVKRGTTIKNVTVNIGVQGISAVASEYYAYAGGLVGYGSNATITNCYVTGNVSATSTSFNRFTYAGGLVGSFSGSITNCYATGNVSATSAAVNNATRAGGLIGACVGTITNCYATSNVSAVSSSYVSYAGGLIGYGSNSTITNCYATGNVSGKGEPSAYVGGLIGESSGTITNCYATGNVSLGTHAGGLIGVASDNGSVINCYATGNVSAVGAYYAFAGGLFGVSPYSTITNCYRRDNQSITGSTVNTSGTPLTSAQMKDKTNFKNWNFNTVWGYKSGVNNGYPILRVFYEDSDIISVGNINNSVTSQNILTEDKEENKSNTQAEDKKADSQKSVPVETPYSSIAPKPEVTEPEKNTSAEPTGGIEGFVFYVFIDDYNTEYPLFGVVITLYDISNPSKIYKAVTDKQGMYKINCPEGRYRMEIKIDNDIFEVDEIIKITKGKIEIFDLIFEVV